MDKAIVTMQADMSWVREDMRVVHEMLDRVAEHVCGLPDDTYAAGKPQQGTCVSPSPWGSWGGGTLSCKKWFNM